MTDTSPQRTARRYATLPGTRILLVEDDELLRIALASLLRTAGAAVIEAGDAEAAAEALAGEGVDLVLSDVQLPGRSGVWLAAWVHDARPALPVILMSGTVPPDGALTASVRRFFPKPVDPEALIREIAALHRG